MLIRTVDVLFALLIFETYEQLHSLPYMNANGTCGITEYKEEESNLCCKRCLPGTRLKKKCSIEWETECEACPPGQYMESMNYFKNCHKCLKCDEDNGLRYTAVCKATKNSQCACQTGTYCSLGFGLGSQCDECIDYTSCEPGSGVSKEVSADSDVECAPCPDGTFSDEDSYTHVCQPHTDCESQGRRVQSRGNAISDSVCEPMVGPASPTSQSHPETERAPSSLQTTTVPPPLPSAGRKEGVTPDDRPPGHLVAVIIGTIGVVSLVIFAVIAGLKNCKKGSAPTFPKKTDENGNKESAVYSGPQLDSVTSVPPEQQSLLGKEGEPYMPVSLLQSPTQPRSPQSTIPQPSSLEPTSPLTSSPQPTIPQTTIPQPTSPQPQVKVNITLHVEVGNGSGAMLCTVPSDWAQTDPELPLGREEEGVSLAQQEGISLAQQEGISLAQQEGGISGAQQEGISLAQQEGGKDAFIAMQESGNYLHT